MIAAIETLEEAKHLVSVLRPPDVRIESIEDMPRLGEDGIDLDDLYWHAWGRLCISLDGEQLFELMASLSPLQQENMLTAYAYGCGYARGRWGSLPEANA